MPLTKLPAKDMKFAVKTFSKFFFRSVIAIYLP
ncbi:hypothetical protein X925_05200 [Petrotoga sp. 9T1HF07.CasAA.8.2]|nr:hypothetical protein X925_05200 [Petrotoga sp. 9T1HF07.CasAA.8.2]